MASRVPSSQSSDSGAARISFATHGASEESFQLIINELPGILWVFNTRGVCSSFNRLWCEYSGVSFSEVGDGYVSFVHPDDLAGWANGINGGKEFETELRLRRHDGVYRWHNIRAVPVRDSVQQILGWVALGTDIELHKQAQLESAAAQASLSEANETLERKLSQQAQDFQEVVEQLEGFSYSIAHDMRAPLRAMHQYAQKVAQDFAESVPSEALVYLNKIMAAAEKVDALIREVLVYTRVSQGRIEMQATNLERLLSEVLLVNPQLGPPEVELNARLPLGAVIGDETALTQVVFNLLSNAVKFVPNGRKPKVNIWTQDLGENVRISIQDNGIGIPLRDRATNIQNVRATATGVQIRRQRAWSNHCAPVCGADGGTDRRGLG
jgi:PAS domain S-box-containing protein